MLDQLLSRFHPINPYIRAGEAPLTKKLLPPLKDTAFSEAEVVVANVSFTIQVKLPRHGRGESPVRHMFLRQIRQSGPHYFFWVDTNLEGEHYLFSSAKIEEMYVGLHRETYVNPHWNFPLSWTWFSKKTAHFFKVYEQSINDLVDWLRQVSDAKYQRILAKIHLLLFLAMEDGIFYESERSVLRQFMLEEIKDTAMRECFHRYSEDAFVTIPAFREALNQLLPLEPQEVDQLMRYARKIVAADEVFSEAEMEFLENFHQILRQKAREAA